MKLPGFCKVLVKKLTIATSQDKNRLPTLALQQKFKVAADEVTLLISTQQQKRSLYQDSQVGRCLEHPTENRRLFGGGHGPGETTVVA
jgi:hypothetical protein